MPPDENNDRLIGRLEKGVEELEKAVRNFQIDQTAQVKDIMAIIQSNHEQQRNDIRDLTDRIFGDSQFSLTNQMNLLKADSVNMRLSVQKLSATVSIVVGVGIYIAKELFSAAKDVIAGTFWPS